MLYHNQFAVLAISLAIVSFSSKDQSQGVLNTAYKLQSTLQVRVGHRINMVL